MGTLHAGRLTAHDFSSSGMWLKGHQIFLKLHLPNTNQPFSCIVEHQNPMVFYENIHQKFQVAKMEVLNLIKFIRLFWGWVFPYLSFIHTAYYYIGGWPLLVNP